jgi:hypothetical protein
MSVSGKQAALDVDPHDGGMARRGRVKRILSSRRRRRGATERQRKRRSAVSRDGVAAAAW